MGQTDYKHLLKACNLSINQKKVLYAICMSPTAHPYSYIRMYPGSKFSSGGIRSGLIKLTCLNLVMKDDAGVWRIKNLGILAWLKAIRENRMDDADSLRFGEWSNTDFDQMTHNSNYDQVHKRAVEVFESEENAKKWMHNPIFALGNQIPAVLIKEPGGTELIMNILCRMEYGVFS